MSSARCTTHHHACDCREAKFAALEAENLEQARLLGMGGSREAALLAKVAGLEAENARLRGALVKSDPPEGKVLREVFEAAREVYGREVAMAHTCPEKSDNPYTQSMVREGYECRVCRLGRALEAAAAAAPSSPGQDVEELIDAIVAVPDASKWGPTKGDFKNYKAALEAWWRIYGDLTVGRALATPAPSNSPGIPDSSPAPVEDECGSCDYSIPGATCTCDRPLPAPVETPVEPCKYGCVDGTIEGPSNGEHGSRYQEPCPNPDCNHAGEGKKP